MIDVNSEAEKSLSRLDCTVVYAHGACFTELPAVSFYSVAESAALCCDNEESVQSGRVQVDVWAKKAKKCGDIALSVNDVLTADGWVREMSADVPEQDGKVYHKTMRFQKYFNV